MHACVMYIQAQRHMCEDKTGMKKSWAFLVVGIVIKGYMCVCKYLYTRMHILCVSMCVKGHLYLALLPELGCEWRGWPV